MTTHEPGPKPRSVTRKQHIVPRVLLAGFTDENGNVQVTHRDGRSHPESMAKASVVKDFYSFRDAEGHLDDLVERWLGEHVEGPAAAALRKAQRGLSPEAGDVHPIARFVAASLSRTHYARSIMEQLERSHGPGMLADEALRAAGLSASSLTRSQRAFVLARASEIWREQADENETRKGHLRTVQRQIDVLTPKLQLRRWTVLTADHPVLLTSDATVVSHPQTGKWQGLAPDDLPIYMPVSPWHLLLGENHPLGASDTRLPGDLTRLVNLEIVRLAHDAVVARPGMPWPEGITLMRSRPRLPSPTIRITSNQDGALLPTGHPPVRDEHIRKTLEALGASDEVE